MSKSSLDARSGLAIMPRASTVRTLCLLVISMGLLMLYVGVYVEQSRLQCDHVPVSRDDSVAKVTRDVINVTSRRSRVGDESSAEASWDYNWDSYVHCSHLVRQKLLWGARRKSPVGSRVEAPVGDLKQNRLQILTSKTLRI